MRFQHAVPLCEFIALNRYEADEACFLMLLIVVVTRLGGQLRSSPCLSVKR